MLSAVAFGSITIPLRLEIAELLYDDEDCNTRNPA
jgi:hypothetical protein